jgi:hypothetical protein
LIFPAVPAALCVIYAWRRLRLAAQARIWARQHQQDTPVVNNAARLALVALCIGFLPWLHSVYLSLSLPLVLYMLLGGRDFLAGLGRWRRQRFTFSILAADISLVAFTCAFIVLTVFGGLFLLYYIYYYGTPLPNTQDHAGFAPLTFVWDGLLGLFFDQKYGLLIYAPFYLIALAGIVLLFFKPLDVAKSSSRRSDLSWFGLVALPNFLIMADYNQWWGEWCPPARYLVPILPLLAFPFATALQEMRGWLLRSFYGVALGWSLAVAGLVMYNPHLEYHWQDTHAAKILQFLQSTIPFLQSQNLGAWFPSYVTPLEPSSGLGFWLAPLLWFLGAVGIAWALVWQSVTMRNRPSPPDYPESARALKPSIQLELESFSHE